MNKEDTILILNDKIKEFVHGYEVVDHFYLGLALYNIYKGIFVCSFVGWKSNRIWVNEKLFTDFIVYSIAENHEKSRYMEISRFFYKQAKPLLEGNK